MVGGVGVTRNCCNLWHIVFIVGLNHLVWIEEQQQRMLKKLQTHRRCFNIRYVKNIKNV
jgi:hypothetical protein